MRVEGTYTFPGERERVFAALTDPDALARAIPGCERLIQFGPANTAGEVAYETRLRLGQRRVAYTVTVRVVGTRPPDYLRLEIRGYGPAGAITGDGSLDLVTQDAHTVVAYRLSVSGQDIPEGSDAASQAGAFVARATCAHLADEVYTETDTAPVWLPGAVSGYSEADSSRGKVMTSGVDKSQASEIGAPLWAERMVWMGAGLALGLGAIVVTLGVVRWLGGHDSAAG